MLSKDNRPKWKHIGKKSQWVYPAYLPMGEELILHKIENCGEAIIVESIGDALSLFERGHYNILVSFGLEVGPALIGALVQLNPNKIIISFNNDVTQPNNRGLIASLKNYLKLLSYFDHHKLFICLPTANDFGEMDASNFEKWGEKLNHLEPLSQAGNVLQHSKGLADGGHLSKKLLKNRNLLKNILDE